MAAVGCWICYIQFTFTRFTFTIDTYHFVKEDIAILGDLDLTGTTDKPMKD
jgi:hypothetical protein